MATFGRALLIVAFALTLYGIGASLYGAIAHRRAWVDSGRRAVYSLAGVLTVAFVVLEAAFLRNDFSFSVVATHSSTTTPTGYKMAAAWSSQEGSLLLWVWLLSLWSSLVLYLTRRRVREIAPYATAVLLGFGAFFLMLVIFFASPFKTLANPPLQGTGLDALLLHPAMMIHPPMLYSGYTLCAVPFAFAIGALITRQVNVEWVQITRRFALGAWLFLGIGIILGARWSYTELGWGGYWGWDAVENASLLPWLTMTAYIHSIMIQEKRGMLKVWNATLVLATGTLAILGTFLVRSGILDSIHAFGASTLGVPFLILIGVMIVGSIGLVVGRRGILRSEHSLDSFFSREAIFIVQNIVLVGMAFVVFWGTFFPLISEAVTGTKTSVGPPWFDRYTVPLALVLVVLTGVGPLIAWRRATLANLRRNFVVPLLVALVALVALLAIGAGDQPKALLMFVAAAFVIGCVGQELFRGTRARQTMSKEAAPVALVSLVRRNRRRYGGYIAHVGFAVLLLAVAASSSFQHAKDISLTPGQSTRIDGYTVRYTQATAAATAQKISLGARVDISKAGKHVTTLRTTRNFYPSQDTSLGIVGRFFNGDSDSVVGLRAGVGRDLWTVINPDLKPLQPIINQGDATFRTAMTTLVRNGGSSASVNKLYQLRDTAIAGITQRFITHPWAADFRILVSPLASWIWIGAIIIALGGLIAIWPMPHGAARRVRAGYAARVARDLARS
ncbi:MAG: cytochrome c assembly protein [Conexibacter sp.]|nr:cytochrome c assembly protein [Conexibacter sp.]